MITWEQLKTIISGACSVSTETDDYVLYTTKTLPKTGMVLKSKDSGGYDIVKVASQVSDLSVDKLDAALTIIGIRFPDGYLDHVGEGYTISVSRSLPIPMESLESFAFLLGSVPKMAVVLQEALSDGNTN